MRSAILACFLSLWIFAIVAPSIITIVDKGQESVLIFNHTEEEQQESGEKHKFEEKIVPDNIRSLATTFEAEKRTPINTFISLNSSHIQEIFLPPPERI